MNRWLFLLSIFVWVTLKILFISKIPVLGDEAYYIAWGFHSQGGYYDHPPVIGWWATLAHIFPGSVYLFRAFGALVQLSVAFMFWRLMLPYGANFARAVAALTLLAPVHWLAALMAPDAPMILFYIGGVVLFYMSQQPGRPRYPLALLAGASIGASFLSKYFALTFFPSVLIYVLMERRKETTKSFLMTIAAFLPFAFQHWYWNLNHCFANFGFNLYTRQVANDGTVFQTFGFFLLYIAFLSSPPNWFFLKRTSAATNRIGLETFLLTQWAVPIVLFGITALKKGQGLHWFLAYVPIFIVWLALRQDTKRLNQWAKAGVAWSGVFALAAVFILYADDSWLKGRLGDRRYKDWIVAKNRVEFSEWLRARMPENVQASVADNYTYASMVHLALGRAMPVGVFGQGNRFGRSFDQWVNWHSLDGKNLVWFGRDAPDARFFEKFFEKVELQNYAFRGEDFAMIKLIGFRFDIYRREVLANIEKDFYPFANKSRACFVSDQVGSRD